MPSESELWSSLGASIIQAPDDDQPRLRFAENLETTGGAEKKGILARARFIRVQLKLHQLSPDHPEWVRLSTEAFSLLLDNEQAWTPEWFSGLGIRDPQFHRGFVECITVPAGVLIEHQRRIFADAPIRHLDIVDLPKGKLKDLVQNLARSNSYLVRLISLRLDGQGITDGDVQTIVQAPWVGLRWLSLANNEISETGAQALTDDRLSDLRFVDLHGNPFDPAAALVFDQGFAIEKRQQSNKPTSTNLTRFQPVVLSGQVMYPNRFQMSAETSK